MNDTSFKNARILIVDDNASNIEVLEDLLHESGYSIIESTVDPRLAVGLVQSFQPDIILLDLMMPHLDGFEVMDQLKTVIPFDSYLPVLVLTADIAQETRLRALLGGAKDFLSKPFDLYEVRARIANLLETRHLHLQLKDQNQILEVRVKERTHELEKAYQKIELANKELSGLDKAKSEFLNLISHELRTPLNGILGFTNILKEMANTPEVIEYLEYLDKSAKRLEHFSCQALLITNLRAGKYKLDPQKLSIEELFQQTKNLLQEPITSKSITFLQHNISSSDFINGDRELIQICFDRILDNSIKYSPIGSEITITIRQFENKVLCEFIDSGSGFKKEVLENPFRLFSNTSEHVDENTGLNLLLIKYIMDAHNGQIEIYNNERKGATVRLTFVDQNQAI